MIIVLGYVGGEIRHGPIGAEYSVHPRITISATESTQFSHVKNEIYKYLGYTEERYSLEIFCRYDIEFPGPDRFFQLIPLYNESGWQLIFQLSVARKNRRMIELYIEPKRLDEMTRSQCDNPSSIPSGTSPYIEYYYPTDDDVGLPDNVIKEKSVSAIREFYSARDKEEVAMCIEELNSPGSYHLVISTWVLDSFQRKEMERDLLYKLLVDLCKPNGGIFSQAQLHQGLETVLSTLEDAVYDAPKAPEYLGKLFGKFITENVTSLKEIGRLVIEGGEEPGTLVEAGLGGDVIGRTLEYIKFEKGDTFLKEARAGSNLRLEDFKSRSSRVRSKKLDPFL